MFSRLNEIVQASTNVQGSINVQGSNNHLQNDNNISPFVSNGNSGTFVMYLEPILNTYWKSYQNVITLDSIPPGPLSRMVSKINMPKLSSFQSASLYASPFYNGSNCSILLLRYPVSSGGGQSIFKVPDNLMGADDIPSVFSYLRTHGYTIDVSLTKMLFDGPVVIGGVSDKQFSGNRRMIAMVSYGL
jgi:hypothetical protein